MKVLGLKHHVKPSVRHVRDHFMLDIRASGLNSDKSPEFIVKSVADVGPALKN